MANTSSKIQFITSFDPGNTKSANQQRRVHSHAARTAHAKARRLRMIDYQECKTRPAPEGSQETETRMDSVLSEVDAVETEKALRPSPVSLLASDRRDPFNSFARSLEPIEHFLLDHCESLLPLSRSRLLGNLSLLEVPPELCLSYCLTNLSRRKRCTSRYEHPLQQTPRPYEIHGSNDQGVGAPYTH